MKKISYFFIVMSSLLMMTMTSCVNNLEGNEDNLPSNVATVQEQVSAMKSSVLELESIQTKLSEVSGFEEYVALVEDCATSVKEHIASVENGLSGAYAAIAAMELQGQVAYAAGTVKVALDIAGNDDFQKDMVALEKSVSAWLGKSFETYSDVLMGAYASQAAVEGAASLLGEHHGYVDAILSDVEAGLRSGVEAKELASVLETLANNLTSATELDSKVDEIILNLETECAMAVEALFDEPSSYDASTLKKASTQARIQLKSAEVTISDLVSRIETIETDIEAIKTRISQLEADVNELLGMIQSVTFLSEYSEEYVIAYYEMDNNSKVTALGKPYDGKSRRTPVETIELNYMIRPASAAAAVTNGVVSVVGYYADKIQTKAIDPTKFVNFTVTDVSVTNAERGIVTVRMSHNLQNDFYYRETGAKCALFIDTGKTDVASKFVEIYPKDKSTNVYVDGIKIEDVNVDVFEIDEGKTKTFTAVVTPSDATNKTMTWSSSDPEIATINPTTGELTGVLAGDVTITAKTNDVNEWGDQLTASVKVKVLPAIRLGGPLYVEVGKTAELSLSFPPAMNVESKVWMSSSDTTDVNNEDTGRANVNELGVVTGIKYYYNTNTYNYNPVVVISCIVNGNITLTHEMNVIALQPTGIRFNGYADDVTSVSMKYNESISLAGTILPNDVEAEYFRIKYYPHIAPVTGTAAVSFIDDRSGEINNPGIESIGSWTIRATVDDDNDNDNRLVKEAPVRYMNVNVEPYYVESVTLPATMNMAPNSTATLTATFTSDVDGKQPTNTVLTWESNYPEIVSVNAKTGALQAKAKGTATITAKTTEGATSDSSVKTATCVVTVADNVDEINIGDYYYSDGDWSTTLDLDGDDDGDDDRSVIGVIFSKVNAVASDPVLASDYPLCSNGLVVSITEYEDAFGDYYYSDMNARGIALNLGNSTLNPNIPNGYGLTLAYGEYRENYAESYSYCEMFDKTDGVPATHTGSVTPPSGASAWYIPSYYEMQQMYENKDTLNDALEKVGDQLKDKGYIHTTLWTTRFEGRTYDDCSSKLYNMGDGGWNANTSNRTEPFPVRVVLAF